VSEEPKRILKNSLQGFERMRMAGVRVIAASGYFDPLQVGHIEYFRNAKRLGGYLVVIINTTEQTLQKKGYEFMPLEQRMRIVIDNRYVDEVLSSVDRDTSVCKSLELIRPDIFAKGGDRFAKEIPESPICADYNIKIVDGLGEKIQSSSDLVLNAIHAYKKRRWGKEQAQARYKEYLEKSRGKDD